jgi:hypothetical protein
MRNEEQYREELEKLVRDWQEFAESILVLQDLPQEHQHPWMLRKRKAHLDQRTSDVLAEQPK